jgi:uncharacterized short protein YbdD (DUF466 family)
MWPESEPAAGAAAPRGWKAWLSGFKRVAGMPDYPGYLAHMRERHPECPALSEREYFDAHLQARYGSGVSRCC